MRWTILVVLAAATLAACGADPLRRSGDPTVHAALGDTVRLGMGQIAEIASPDGLRLRFAGVSADSRCPLGVTCVWSGDATARLGTATGNAEWTWTALHTHEEPKQVRHERYTVVLLDVEPYPRDGESIRADAYVAVLRVDGP